MVTFDTKETTCWSAYPDGVGGEGDGEGCAGAGELEFSCGLDVGVGGVFEG